MRLRAPYSWLALAAVVLSIVACTETPDDLPECIGPGAYCPSLDGGSETGNEAGDGTPDASTTARDASDAANDG